MLLLCVEACACVSKCTCHVNIFFMVTSPWLSHLHGYLTLIISSPWLPHLDYLISMVTSPWFSHIYGYLTLILSSLWLTHLDSLVEFNHLHGSRVLHKCQHLHQILRSLWLLECPLPNILKHIADAIITNKHLLDQQKINRNTKNNVLNFHLANCLY